MDPSSLRSTPNLNIGQGSATLSSKGKSQSAPDLPSTGTITSPRGGRERSCSIDGSHPKTEAIASTHFKPTPVPQRRQPIAHQQQMALNGSYLPQNVMNVIMAPVYKLGMSVSEALKLLSANKNHIFGADPQKGEVYTDSFNDNHGNKIAEEQVVRFRTVDFFRSGLQAKLSHLEKRKAELEGSPGSEKSLEVVNKAIAQVKEDSAKLEKLPEKTTWASTNAPRWLFIKGNRKAKSEAGPSATDAEILQKGREIAKQEYIPITGNLRSQRIQVEGGDPHYTNRSAALSDFSNNETNLTEMRDFQLLKAMVENPQKTMPFTELDRLSVYYDFSINRKEGGVGQVQDQKALLTAYNKVKSNLLAAYGDNLRGANDDVDMGKLDDKITERRYRLDNLFLQDLVLQHKNGSVGGKGVFRYARQALVNTTAGPNKGEGGLVLHERNQALDTRAAIMEYNGKPIIYDQESEGGAFIDPETGNIHLPASLKPEGEGESTILQSRFSNISVAVDTKNLGLQAHINNETLAQIREDLNLLKKDQSPEAQALHAKGEKLYIEVKAELDAGRGGFDVAEKMTLLLALQNNLSINCYGGKDRTGYAVALISYNVIKDSLINKKMDEKTLASTMARIGTQLMNGTAMGVVEDNTGTRAIKLMPPDLKLYLSESKVYYLGGLGKRICGYFDVAKSMVAPGDIANKIGEGSLFDEVVAPVA